MTLFIIGLILGVCITVLIWERFYFKSKSVKKETIELDVIVNSKQAIEDLKEMELAMKNFKKENNLL